MRKIISIILVMMIFQGFAVIGSADMDVPRFSNYEAIVGNVLGTEGVKISFRKDDKETKYFPFGTRLTVTDEYVGKSDGVKYAACKYKDEHYEVPFDDLRKTSEEFIPDESFRLKRPIEFVCINEDGADIRKGPADSYKSIGKIPYGTKVTAEYAPYADYSDEDSVSYGYWYYSYVNYNGIKGWTRTIQYGIGFDFATVLKPDSRYTGKLTTVKEKIRLIKIPVGYNEEVTYVSEEIPANTVLSFNIYYTKARCIWALTEYKGVKGWIITDEGYNGGTISETATGRYWDIKSKERIKVYTKPFDGGSFTGKYLTADKVVRADMKAEKLSLASYRVKIDGITGWVTGINECDYDKCEATLRNYEICRAVKDFPIYDDYYTKNRIGLIKSGDTFVIIDETSYFDPYICVDFDGVYGWFQCSDSEKNEYYTIVNDISAKESSAKSEADGTDTTLLSEPETEAGNPTEGSYTKSAVTEIESITEPTAESDSRKQADTFKTVATICISAAVLVSLVMTVCIIVVAKKKKSSEKK